MQSPTGTREVLVARVKPHEDIVHAAKSFAWPKICAPRWSAPESGSWSARLRVADWVVEVLAPAVEVNAVVGEVRTDARGVPAATLTATFVGESGQVHGGELVCGANPAVAITYELFLEPIRAGEEAE